MYQFYYEQHAILYYVEIRKYKILRHSDLEGVRGLSRECYTGRGGR